MVVAGADGDIHIAGHAADGAARRSNAQGTDCAAYFGDGLAAGDGNGAGDGEVPNGAGDVAEQAGIAFGVLKSHAADGKARTVKGAGVDGRCVADGRPVLAVGDGDVVSQHRAGGDVLAVKLRMGVVAVHQPRKPEQLPGVGDFIDVPIQFGELVAVADGADAVGIILVAVVYRAVGIDFLTLAVDSVVHGAVAAVQHGIFIHGLAVVQVLVPAHIFAGGAVEQPAHLAGGKLVNGFGRNIGFAAEADTDTVA